MQHAEDYANLAVDGFFTVRYICLRDENLLKGHRETHRVNDGTGSMRRLDSNQANTVCSSVGSAFPCVMADGHPILARAKLSALRSRGKCVAGYSPPVTRR